MLASAMAFSFAGCAKKPTLELGSVDEPSQIVVGVISAPGTYTIEGSSGLYANSTIGNKKVTFLGVCDYNPSSDKEASKIPDGSKALVAAFSVEKLAAGTSENISASNFYLVHADSSALYRANWNIDEDIEITDKKIAGTVVCNRLVFLVPKDTKADEYLFILDHKGLTTPRRFSMGVPQEEIAGTAIDYINMCPLCFESEYQYDHLVIGTCEKCGRKFTSGHSPCQRICFSCSVIYNYCTQCMRFIEQNNTTIIKKK